MAKKKESIYKSWDEIDKAMRKLAELNIKKQKLEGLQTVSINNIKSKYSEQAEPIIAEIKELEKEIERFANENKAEFVGKRSKKLNFGTISFRIVKSVACDCLDAAIKALKVMNLDGFVRSTETLDKEALASFEDEKVLLKAGIHIKQADKVKIDPDYVKLASLKP